MQDFFEVVTTRRTVRSYTADPVSRQEIQELIDLAVLAPTAMNAQPWAFTVVTDPAVMGRLDAVVVETLRTPAVLERIPSERLRQMIGDPAFTIFYQAPALIAIHGDSRVPAAMIDCQLAAENLFLAAHARGLGSCYMGFLTMAADHEEVRRLLRIPEGNRLMAAAVVGRPAALPDGPPRRNPPRIEWVG